MRRSSIAAVTKDSTWCFTSNSAVIHGTLSKDDLLQDVTKFRELLRRVFHISKNVDCIHDVYSACKISVHPIKRKDNMRIKSTSLLNPNPLNEENTQNTSVRE